MSHGTAYAGFEFTDLVRTILHRGKYGGDRAALEALGALTVGRLAEPLDGRTIRSPRDRASAPTTGAIAAATPPAPDAVIPVPLGPRRRRHRGYNQSEIVAQALAHARRVPLLTGLRRTRETAPQTARDEESRRSNVAGAFTWDGVPLTSAAIWLVDDVLTTGATLDAAATVLGRAGTSRIDVVVIAVVP